MIAPPHVVIKTVTIGKKMVTPMKMHGGWLNDSTTISQSPRWVDCGFDSAFHRNVAQADRRSDFTFDDGVGVEGRACVRPNR